MCPSIKPAGLEETMKKIPLRVGIAGFGVVGKRRHSYINQHPELKTVSVSDQYFKSHGILDSGITYHPDYRSLIEENIDILFVCLPNYLAADATIEGLAAGCHVFCEKPPGCTVHDIERVIQAEKRHPDQVLKYGFNHRYHDSVRKALEIVASGKLGHVVNLRGTYGKSKIIPFSGGWRAQRKYAGGGVLLDQGIHMVDLIRLFCSEFVEVKSFVSNAYWKHDVEDNAYAIMKDACGRIAMLHSSATQWQHRFVLDIALTEGFIELRGILSGSKSYGQETIVVGRRDESDYGTLREETFTYLEDNSWRDEINEFADAAINGLPIKAGSSSDAQKAMSIVYQIYHSDKIWRTQYNIQDP